MTAFDTPLISLIMAGSENIQPNRLSHQIVLRRMNRATQMAVASAKLALRMLRCLGNVTDIRSRSHGTTLGAAQAIERGQFPHTKSPVNADLFSQMPTHAAPAAIAKEFGSTGPFFMSPRPALGN